jgi:hypothetical protein
MTEKKRSHEGRTKPKLPTLAEVRSKRLLTYCEAGVLLNLKAWRVGELVRNDDLPGCKVELGLRTVRIDRIRLEEFIDAGGRRATRTSVPVEKRSGLVRRTAPAPTPGTAEARA